MGDNIHQLTSLPYSNFEDEQSEDTDGQPDHIPNLHVGPYHSYFESNVFGYVYIIIIGIL